MLPEERRLQLDGIVNTMVQNKESDENIRFVVDDFKQKYSQVVSTEKPKTDFLGKTSKVLTSVFGGKQIGENIGTLAGYGYTKAKDIVQGTDVASQYDLSHPTLAQTAGDVASTGLSVAGLKGVGTVGKLLPRILKMAGLGAGISAGKTVAEGGDIKEASKSAVVGGIVGGALPVVGAGLRAIGRQIETLPARFVNSALSRKKAQVLQDISRDRIDDFSNYVLKSKPVGTANKLLDESVKNIDELSNKISTSLGSAVRETGAKTTIGTNNLLDQITKLPEAEGALLKRPDVKSIIERLAPQTKKLLQKESLTITESNQLRQLVDKTLGDRAFLGGQLSSDKIILKKFADTLRETVKSKAPEGTRALFSELSNEIRFRDGLLNKIAQRAGNQVLSFGDFIGGGLGGIFGGGIPGAVGGVAARRVIESVPFKIGAAKLTNSLTKLAPTLEQLAPVQQTAILNFFADIFSGENHPEEQSQ